MKKKLLSFLIAFCLIIPCAFMLVACKEDPKSSKVMTVSANPQLEFVLNEDDIVVSVSALNQDGYSILSADVTLTGISADQAAKVFIETAKEQGFIAEGSQNKIEISISGEAVDTLYNNVKNSISNYLQSVNITTITFEELDKLSKDDIVDELEKCYQEYSESYLESLNEEELINLLKQSRQETKDFLNEEVKELYYQLREQTILAAKLQAMGLTATGIKTSIQTITDEFVAKYFNPESEYNQKLQAYIQDKQAWLADKTAELDASLKNQIATAWSQAQTAMESLVSEANRLISEAQTLINQTIDSLPAIITNQIAPAVEEALSTLKTNFITGELAQYNVNHWETPAE